MMFFSYIPRKAVEARRYEIIFSPFPSPLAMDLLFQPPSIPYMSASSPLNQDDFFSKEKMFSYNGKETVTFR